MKLFYKNTFFISLAVFALAIYFLYNNIVNYANKNELLQLFLSAQIQMGLVATILLQFINWVVEALKLKVLLQSPEKPKFKLIIKAIYIGNFTAILTPERIGNFIGRSWVLRSIKKDAIVSTILGNYVQLCITIFIAFISLMLLDQNDNIYYHLPYENVIILVYFTISVLFIISFIHLKWVTLFSKITYLNSWLQSINRLVEITNRKKVQVICLSFLRYMIFVSQFYIMSKAFGMSFDFVSICCIVGVMFGVVTLIPSLIPGNLGTKEAFLLFLLGSGKIGIKFSIISFSIWIINVGFSALIGAVLNIVRVKN